LLGGVLFLSVASSKLLTYLLPVFPVVALLAADIWERARRGMLTAAGRRMLNSALFLTCLGFAVALPVALFFVQRRFDFRFGGAWLGCAAVAAGMLLPLWRLWRGQSSKALPAACLAVVCVFLFVMTAVMPKVAAELSGRELAQHLNRQGRLPSRLLVLEERIGSVIFYLDPELRAQLKPDQFVNIRVGGFCDLSAMQDDEIAVLPRFRETRVNQYLDVFGVPSQSVGHYRIYTANALLSQRRSENDPEP
jgi:hypothetical protein